MFFYDEELRELSEKIRHKTHLEAIIGEFEERKAELEKKVNELKEIMYKEQEDVERFEKGGFKTFLYEIIGKGEDKLSKEKAEAYEAAVRYNEALKELSEITDSITKAEAKLKPLWYAEEDYERVYSEKRKAIKESDNPAAEELMENERVLQFLINEEKELNEAVSAGKKAKKLSEQLVSSLENVERSSYRDLTFRESSAGFRKYKHLEEAAELSQKLSSALNNFKAELADVKINSDMEISVDYDERFIDIFFDSIFTDYKFYKKVEDMLLKAQKLKSDTAYALAMLTDKLKENQDEQVKLSEKLEKLIINTKL